MAEDWLLSRFSAVARAAEEASRELAEVPDGLTQAYNERLAGVPLPEIARELAVSGAVVRRRIAASYRQYEHAVAELRADVIRALIDEEGVSLSTLARGMGISRQAVGRLYQAGRELQERDESKLDV